MGHITCPVCEIETDAPVAGSDWCSRCIDDTLADQDKENTHFLDHEYVGLSLN
jgi:hypothetical protein